MNKQNKNGYTLIELILATALLGTASLMLIMGLSQIFKSSTILRSATEDFETLLTADRFIRRVGRVATLCTKTQTGLECDVDKNTPATGVLSKVRFLIKGENLVYQVFNVGTNQFDDITTYPGINFFIICDKTNFENSIACSIPGTEGRLAGTSSRYFRYQLKSIKNIGKEQEIHSAFYVRNPTPFGANVVYQWGE